MKKIMNEKNDEKNHHDVPAKIYQINSRKFIPGYDGLYALAQILLAENLPDNAEILIIGAGGGKEVTQFGAAFPTAKLVGVDPAEAPLAAARELVEKAGLQSRITLHPGTIDDLDEKQYDAATALLVMHFLPDDGAKSAFLEAIYKRLKPGGKLILADGCYDKNNNPAEFDWLLNAFANHARMNDAPPEVLDQTLKFINENSQSITEARELELFRQANFGDVKKFFQALWFRAWTMKRL